MMSSRVLAVSISLPVSILLAVPSHGQTQDGAAPSINPLASLDKSTLGAFVDKPLFEPTRRPPAPATAIVFAAPQPPLVVEQPPLLHLLGVVEGAHSLAAIVRHDETGRTETLRPGDRIGGWRIEISPMSLRVVNGERAFDYALFRSGARSGPQPVAQTAIAPSVALRDPDKAGGGR